MAEAATLRHLPADAVQRVCTFLAIRDIARLACTCSSLRQTCLDDRRVWRPRFEREFAATPVNGAQWIVPRSGRAAHRGVSTDDDIDVQAWPAQDYRGLLLRLLPLQALQGVWQLVPLHSRPGTQHQEASIVAFTWLPAALVCLSLQERCSDAGALQWKVACVLSAASVALPTVEPLELGSLLLHAASLRARVQAAAPDANETDRDRAAVGLGRHSASSSLTGTSPSGSFESEFLAFMSTSAPAHSNRARRRSARRAAAVPRVHEWRRSAHLRRLHDTRGYAGHTPRHLRGLWHGVPAGTAPEAFRVPFIDVSYHVASAGTRVYARRPAQTGIAEHSVWHINLAPSQARTCRIEANDANTISARAWLQRFAASRVGMTWNVHTCGAFISPTGRACGSVAAAAAQQLAVAAARTQRDASPRAAPPRSPPLVDTEDSMDRLVAGVLMSPGVPAASPAGATASSSAAHGARRSAGDREVADAGGGLGGVAAPWQGDGGAGCRAERSVGEASLDWDAQGACVEEPAGSGAWVCDWRRLEAAAAAVHRHAALHTGEASLFELRLGGDDAIDGLLMVPDAPAGATPVLFTRLLAPFATV